MIKTGKKYFLTGGLMLAAFVLFTLLIRIIDLRPLGPQGTSVGLATLNEAFHQWTGVHIALYTITDWMGLIPVMVCMAFAFLGLVQLIKRKSLLKVDADILVLGVYYMLVMGCYVAFEMIPVNYRPILINGYLEASYPSSSTLLVLTVMPTLWDQASRRIRKTSLKPLIRIFVLLFSGGMVMGRLLSGVHWLTDIVGAVLLSGGLWCLYQGTVTAIGHKN